MNRSSLNGRRVGLRRAVSQFFEGLEARKLMCAEHEGDNLAFDIWTEPSQAFGDSTMIAVQNAAAEATGTPVLHSLPGAPAAIYLDFDGEGARRGYDLDGDASTFNAAEQANITTAWSRVTNYFAMFNVDVTTIKPTVPFAWQLTTPDEGGWSWVNVFPNAVPDSFNNTDSITARTSAYAHELGHNFGMYHQGEWDALGNHTAEYTDGYDDLHGSIMGTDYARNVRKWFWGHDSTSDGATTLQDDLAIIAADLDNYGGDGYRADDYGSSTATATPLTLSGVDQEGSGIIERRTDSDMFSFTSAGGRYLIEGGRGIESGVDIKLEVYDSSGKLVASADKPDQPEAQISMDLPAGTYYLSISGHGNYADQGVYNVQVSPIASGFQSSDIGVVRRAGNSSYNPSTGVWTLVAGGYATSGSTGGTVTTADELRFSYTQLSGDGEIIARVSSSTATNSDGYAGLMIRESLADDSRFAAITLNPGSVARFTRRTTAGSAYTYSTASSTSAPYYLRLTRVGSTITAYRSTDGVNWGTAVGSATVSMGTNVYIGLAASSHVDQDTITATFDHVSLSGAGVGGPAYVVDSNLTAPSSVGATLGTGSGLNISWAAVAGATAGYLVQRSLDGSNFDDLATVSNATFNWSDNNLLGSYRYFYRVLSLGDAGRSTPSTVASAVNRPSAVTNVKTMSISASTIVIDWFDTVGESGYKIERSSDGGATWTVLSSSLAVNRPSYTDSTASAARVYQYRVTPLSSLGDGAVSAVVTEGSRLAAVSPTVSNLTASGVTLSWTDQNTLETGYKIQRSTDNSTWTTLTTVGADVTTYTATGLSALTRYYFRVQAVTPYTESVYKAIPVATPAATVTIAPWATVDIGDTLDSSSTAQLSGGTVTMISAGSDIGSTSDDLHFMYQQINGDGSITARVASLDGPDGAEVGLMFRTSLAANSAYALAMLTNNAASRFMRRTAAGGTTSSTNGAAMANGNAVVAPYWLRLSRTGTSVTASQSADGTTWTTINTATVSLGTTIYVGLALDSQSTLDMAKATFTNVAIVGNTSTIDTTPPAAPVLAGISTDTGDSNSDRITSDGTLIFNGTAEASSVVTVSLDGTVLGTTAASATGAWSYDYSAVALADGTYTLSAYATDAANNGGPSGSWTFTVDTTGPSMSSATFDPEVGHRWNLVFSDDVGGSLTSSSVAVMNRATNQMYYPSLLSWDANTKTAVYGMPDADRLIDGHYQLQLAGGLAGDVAGNAMSGGTLNFDVLSGDVNGDGAVGFEDLLILAKNYGQSGKTFSQGNIDYSGTGSVGFNDLLILAKMYGKTLPALAEPSTAAALAITPAETGATTRKRATVLFADDTIV